MRLTVLNVSYPLATVTPATAGGAEQVLLTIDHGLVRAGHRSIVIAPKGSKCHGYLVPTAAPGQILDDSMKHRACREHAKAIQHVLDNFSVDIVHLHGIDFLEYLPRPDVPVVITLHLPPAWYSKEAFNLRRTDIHFVCVSDFQRRNCPRHANIVRIVANGVAVNGNFGFRKKGNYLLCMGRICPEKGFHLALDAANSAGLPLFLAGHVFEYPEHRNYFEQEIRPRLQSPHRFFGPVGGVRKRQLLAGARCVLIPSMAQETSSLVAMEAASCGTPVIAFRAGALTEVIEHGRTGLLVDSVDEMAEAIGQVGSLDPGLCIRGAAARFSTERMVGQYIELYESVAPQHKRPELEAAC